MFDFIDPAFERPAIDLLRHVGDFNSGGVEPIKLGALQEIMGLEGEAGRQNQIGWNIAEQLAQKGLLVIGNSEKDDDGVFRSSVSLTSEGWKAYRKIIDNDNDGLPYGFIALPFHEPELENVVQVLERKIRDKLGFLLVDLNDRARAGIIDDNLREQIENSSFVLAELTHGNPGAYWEAGYAEGKGIPVVYICEKEKFKEGKTHFDTNHRMTVFWAKGDLEAFSDELVRVLKQSIGKSTL